MDNTQKTHWKTYHNPDYIGAYAFQENERKILQIKSARQEAVIGASGKREDCLVVHFSSADKPLICNVTNSKAISKVAGSPYIEDWAGHHIELFVTQVSAFGDTVDAVRVKTTAPKLVKPRMTDKQQAQAIKRLAAGQLTRETIEQHYLIDDNDWEALTEAAMELTQTTINK